MSSPSKMFELCFASHRDHTELSVQALNRRYLLKRQLDPALTPELFFSDRSNLERERASISFDIGGHGRMRLIDVCRALARPGLSAAGARYRLNAFLARHPNERSFSSIDALGLCLEREAEANAGTLNPVLAGASWFRNLSALRDAHREVVQVSRRTLAERVAALKEARGLRTQDTLQLEPAELSKLLAREEVKHSFVAFAAALGTYLQEHRLQLVRSCAETSHAEITFEEAYARYENNRTLFRFRCQVCAIEAAAASTFEKPLSHWHRQGCPRCGSKRARAERKLPASEVRRRIHEHPAGIDWVDHDDAYQTNASPLTVRCRDVGHEVTRRAEDFFSKGAFKQCPECSGGRLGETIAVVVVNFLLATGKPAREAREATPPHLRAIKAVGAPLRHDGYFELKAPAIKLAVEHMGDQHFYPGHVFHVKSPLGRDESFRRMLDRDEQKRVACRTTGVLYVALPDLASACSTVGEAARFVADQLRAQTCDVVRGIPGFESRVAQLDDAAFVRALIRGGALLPPEQRLQRQLDAEMSTVEILDYDPIAKRFQLRCCVHPREEPWFALATNAIGSKAGERSGTRCRRCKADKLARERKLSQSDLDDRARAFGFMRDFCYSKYERNSQRLPWRCISDPSHETVDTLSHLSRGCSTCRAVAQLRAEQARGHADIAAIAAARGDVVLSEPDDYLYSSTKLRLRCAREGGCGDEYWMSPSKIRAGQMCACDAPSRAAWSQCTELNGHPL